MTWDDEDREKLLRTLRRKRSSLLDECYSSKVFRRRWNEFLNSHGIVPVETGTANPKSVMLDDAYGFLGLAGRIFSIPKDVAEKLLVLGAP